MPRPGLFGSPGASGADVITTRGDLIRGGVGGVAERLPAPAVVGHVPTWNGTDVEWAAPAGGGGGEVTAWDAPVDDGSWLLEGTASIAAGLISLSATAGSSDGGRAAASRAPSAATPSGLELVADPLAWDAVIRVASLTGDANCYAGLYARFRGGDEIRFWYDAGGSVQCGYLGAAWTLITAYAAGLTFDGTQWLKLSVRGSTVTYWYGNGTTTEPPAETAWTRLATYDASASHSSAFRLYREVGPVATSYGGSPVAATFDRLRVRNAGPSARAW